MTVRTQARVDTTAQHEAARHAEDDSVQGSAQLLGQFKEEGQAVQAHERQPYRGSLSLSIHNLGRGLESLEPHRSEVEKRDGITLAAFERLPQIALALAFALSEVRRMKPTRTEIAGMTDEGYGLRRLFVASIEALIAKRLLPDNTLDIVRPGHCGIDLARDLVALVAILLANTNVTRNRVAYDDGDLKRGDELGQLLQLVLKPKGARDSKEDPPEVVELEALIDGLWTLIVRGHAEMRKSAYLIWGDDFSEHVPPLLSREMPRPAPAPVV